MAPEQNAVDQFVEMLDKARAAGKDWWVDLQIRQIEEYLWLTKQVSELRHALEIVRDADNDCKTDGGHPLPIPEIVRAVLDRALKRAAFSVDPEAKSFALYLEERRQ
jgi:hypothetical protein